MKNANNDFFIKGIHEKNLKGFDFQINHGDIVFIGGVSGSGKSTLVLDVIYREAHRQHLIRNATDDLYQYAVRPNFSEASMLVESDMVTQRGLFSSITSTFGTKTNLINDLRDIFVKYGVVKNDDRIISKNTFNEVINFKNKLYSDSHVYYILNLRSFNEVNVLKSFKKDHIAYVRNLKTNKITKVQIDKLKKYNSDDYFFLVEAEYAVDSFPLFLIGNDIEINFDEKYIDVENNILFSRPYLSLFTKSKSSTNSGLCVKCGGNGDIVDYDRKIIDCDKKISENNILLNTSEKTGRYESLKFTPNGLVGLLKRQNIDINKTYNQLSEGEKGSFDQLILDKLVSNNVESLLLKSLCNECNGTGYKADVSHIFVGNFNFTELEKMTLEEILVKIGCCIEANELADFTKKNNILKKLKINNIALNRGSLNLSSGEVQRIKIFDLLKNKIRKKIIIIDEPSVNLHYNDNIPILNLLLELNKYENTLIIIDHNEIYKKISNKSFYLGPGSGSKGGLLFSPDDEKLVDEYKRKVRHEKEVKFLLAQVNNVNIDQISIPEKGITCCIGSSGSGKTTLLTKLLPKSFEESNIKYAIFDSKPISTNIQSIVATYINVFDKIRTIFAKKTNIEASFFSFNSRGGCSTCKGHGIIENNLCPSCLGTRYSDDIRLIKVGGNTINDILHMEISSLIELEDFKFLSNIYQFMEALGLDHLTLGRSVSSLSGGEAQRLKLVEFLLSTNNVNFIILDEPCRGLDKKSISKMLKLFDENLYEKSILVIEHNIDFIKQCDFIIDLGESNTNKTKDNITLGCINDFNFPSLEIFDFGDYTHNNFQFDVSLNNEIKENYLLSKTLINQQNFALEKSFYRDSVFNSDENIIFYKNHHEINKVNERNDHFFYNPFFDELYQFPYIDFKKNKFIENLDEAWSYLVETNSFEDAFIRGKGVVATKNKDLIYHTVRSLSVIDKHIGPLIDYKNYFNVYKNSCRICKGYGIIKSYPFDEYMDKKYSIFDYNFLDCDLLKILPKKLIKFLINDFKFPFDLPFNDLSLEAQNIILYGAKHINFIPSLTDDKGVWRGLNSYTYFYGSKLNSNFKSSAIRTISCPCCYKGFNNSVNYFSIKGEKIFDFY
ncbi:ATP-binding cassette domain-containing protein [Acinetobacter nematophilus]|uniref:UvrABC system protein A n=1 Tax=Acinetobacter nematophilus TaxID=2994642 RepID=A0A9X3IK69_9GAMM|nr:ATP-binding cassette domain-containing protein [Acinetobacter nematophilus]MCX5470019.1 ATP-binding cassette domain-containing protein [Acinetobacter nematophilus]